MARIPVVEIAGGKHILNRPVGVHRPAGPPPRKSQRVNPVNVLSADMKQSRPYLVVRHRRLPAVNIRLFQHILYALLKRCIFRVSFLQRFQFGIFQQQPRMPVVKRCKDIRLC